MKNNGLNNIIDQKEIALYQGGISHDRSLSTLIRSVKSWNQKAVLILMGYGDRNYIDHLKNLIYKLGLQQSVFFHPAVPSHQLMQYTASANIGIVIYKNTCRNNYYCAPNKLFEYAAANLKIACCNFPEVQQLISRYDLGDTFNPDEEEDIARCINHLLDINTNRHNVNKLLHDYNWKNEEKKLLQLYSNVFNSHRPY